VTVTVSITETNVFTALRAFMLAILPSGVSVIRGQVNRVAEPSGPDYVVLTPGTRTRLATNVDALTVTRTGLVFVGTGGPITFVGSSPISFFSATGAKTSQASTQFAVQVDVHGPNASDNAQIITTLFRDEYACDALAASGFEIQPLYASDPQQLAFINGEAQYEDRWGVDLQLQVNPVVSTPQEFADRLQITSRNVDALYPS